MKAAFCLLFLVAFVTSVIAENSYLFVSPQTIRPGIDITIHGSLLKPIQVPVHVTLDLIDSAAQTPEPISTTQATFVGLQGDGGASPSGPDVHKSLVLAIPDNLPDSQYQLKVTGTGGLTFENKTALQYEAKSSSIFIQTDKAIYKPGQTVHFRILGVSPDLKVLFSGLDVDLYDPNGNKINQWSATEKQMMDASGVYEGEMLMSDAPVLGDWKIKASLGREKEDKTFTVDEYVLPKFEATIELPPYGLTTDADFQGKVTAKYTFGKPVKGMVNLRIKPKWPQYRWANGKRTELRKEIELKFPIDGAATFTVPTKRLNEVQKYLDRAYLMFEANVTETLTGSKMSDDAELQFYEKRYKLEFPNSLPNTFKPGMMYMAVLKVSEQDDSPPGTINGNVKVNITHYKPQTTTTTSTTTTSTTTPPVPPEPIMVDGKLVTLEISRPLLPVIEPMMIMPPWHRPWVPDVETKQPEMTFDIPADGVIEIPFSIPSDIKRVSMEANMEGITAYKSISKSHSPSESYIQLRLMSQTPKTGDLVSIEIRSTDTTELAVYQILAKGQVITTGTVPLAAGILSIPVTSQMTPKTKVIVYYTRADGEVVADGLSFNVDGIFDNKVTIEFNQTQAEPADGIKLTVKADVGSKVNVLAVDKSVLLLKSGNDISKDEVKSELQSYDSADRGGVCDWFCWRWPMPSGGDDASDVFKNAGVVTLTDALIYEYYDRYMPMARGGGLGGGRVMFAAVPMMMVEENFAMAAPPPAAMVDDVRKLKEPKRVRKLFPETWLWKSQNASPSGQAVFEDKVPDTITSWVATAFAVHPETGFGLSETAANLQTFMSFFVQLHLPYSVIRGEKVIVQANVFNYTPMPIYAYILLKRNPDYENIHITSWYTNRYSADVARFIQIPANGVAAVYFPIVPTKIGKIDLNIWARSLFGADAIQKQLLVEPEGTPKEYNVPIIVDLKNQPTLETSVPISYPVATVAGSQRVRVTAIGDLMGPSINGLEDLLKMPYGCGEQNMLNFAPNIFITKYLEITNNLDEAIMDKSRGFMLKGYQKELTYQHKDGSYSAFGNSDPSGSMWLSAFVLKSFVQAKPYIFVDDSLLHKTIDWILKHQNANGTFNEPGKVIHKEMQGGSTSGEKSLTAFVLVALMEARSIEGVQAKIQTAVQDAVHFLERDIGLGTMYELAINSYALKLAESPMADSALAKLELSATVEDGMKYWKKVKLAGATEPKPWERHNGNAINVEMTAYALLTLALNNNTADGISVLKWLTSQRNPNGGFSSTQDTIIALQALSEIAAKVYSRDFNMEVTISGPPASAVSEILTVNPDNALVLQSRELPSDIGTVMVSATGRGLSLVEVSVFYNIDNDDQKPSFALKLVLLEETLNDFTVQVCTSWLDEGVTGMSVIEIGAPSGFAADKESITPHPLLKQVEDGTRKIILYLDEVGKAEQCHTVAMQRTNMVAGTQPVPVKVYDYYEPTNQITTFYVPKSLRESDVCNVCGKECEFCNLNRMPWRGRN